MSETRPPSTLRLHPQVGLVPAMSEAEYRALAADIDERRLQVPLEITRSGVVLDGRHRLRAALELGLTSVPVRIVAPEDALVHMLSAALQRRHLLPSQKAALALELEQYEQAREEARLRQRANLRGATEVATLPPRGERTRELVARAAGVSPRTVQDVIAVREADAQLFERIKAGELPAHRARRDLERRRRDAQLKSPPLPTGCFQLIYADPPWQLGNPDSHYAPEAHYPTLRLEEIKQLEVPSAADALLYLWAVNSHLPQAIEVMGAWGFDYRSNEVWVKPSIGLGVWTRNRHELLLIARRGGASPPEPAARLDSVIEASRGHHSQKPACIYERLERLYPTLSKLELFARGRPRRGWVAWGNEVEAA